MVTINGKNQVVVCDHQARDLLSCVDRAIVLSNEKIIASGSPNEIVNDTSARSDILVMTLK